MRPDDERYFARIEERLDEAWDVAETAKEQGRDPEPEIEIPIARDMADRVENILGIDGVAERVRELEGEMSREEAALELVTDFVDGNVGDYDSREGKIEGAVRTAVALLTEGVVAAPIEGIDRVELLENDDGTEFVNVYYAGPIRSAGGTAQALSVLVADYARSLLDVDEYKPRDVEVERYAEEIALYDKDTGLQYTPKDKESKFIAKHIPVMLDGEATSDEEVSGFRDLERVDTNSARGGMCLVAAEGIALKAPKIQRYTRDLEEVDWPWLQDLIDGTIGKDGAGDGGAAADEDTESGTGDGDGDAEADDAADTEGDESAADDAAGPPRADPSQKFLRDLIAGRPVFTHPSEAGGFRLRYGRARNHGFATGGVHPATMHIVDDFLAAGTQIKTERPGKAHGVVPVDSIEGPTVRLANGEVRRIDDPEEAKELRNGVEKVLDLGEYLVNYGEFVENNHPLAPASYAPEWWVQEFEAAGADVRALRDDPHVDLEHPGVDRALSWAREHDCPLHPEYTYLWHDVSVDAFAALADAIAAGEVVEGVLAIERTDQVQDTLESLLIEHAATPDALRIPTWRPLARSLGIDDGLRKEWDPADLSPAAREYADGENAIRAVNEVAPFEVRERAPTRIGNRMGRPEKSESRDLSPAVHTLFPINEAGGPQRDVAEAANVMDDTGRRGRHELEVSDRVCPDCGEHTYAALCPDCETHTEPHYECNDCGTVCEPDEAGRVECPNCEWEVTAAGYQVVDVNDAYRTALETVGERESAFEILKGVQGLTSRNKTPEPIEKGVLRAKNGVTSFKDGTVRYDMTDLPVTAVRPEELDVTADHFRELGYETDIDGEPLRHDDQVVELRVQDIVLSDGAAEHMLKTADFVDDLLEQFYGLDRFYEVNERDDLVGELVFGMAPHTSAATVGRVVGFTSAAVGYAHPYFHAAKRRNCFHPETKIWYEDEAGKWHYDPIETLVEDRLDAETAEEDDFGTLVQKLDDDVYVPSVTEDGEKTLQRAEALSKHPSPDHLVRVETKSGQELTVTPDHSMRRWTGDGIERVSARELTTEDALPAPKQISVDGETATFDLLAEFLDADAVSNDDLMIRGLGESNLKQLLDDATDAENYLKPVAELLDVSQSTVYNWVSRDSISAGVLIELYDCDTVVERVPTDVTLGIRRDSASISRQFDVDETVGTMLGYYAAEGFTRQEAGSFYQTTICTPDDVPRDEIIDVFDDVFDVEAFEENEWKITVSSRLVTTLFSDVLDAGSRAETKLIPDCVLSAPDSILRTFLAAYFSGDGSTSSERVEVRAHTVSDDLQSDLTAALKRFGIATKVYREERTPKTGAVAEFYDGEQSFESWVLKITSQNAVRFADRVGFHLGRKDETLTDVLDRVDTRTQRLFGDGGDVWVDEVVSVEMVQSDIEFTYCLTVEETNTLVANDVYSGQCDGDEDCVMLLMDGLLNFSKEFLPDQRGGRMDAPLVMSSRIDPSEIDDEAHNVDIVREYPKELYEASREMADPEAVEELIQIGEDTLGTDDEYHGFDHTHDTTDIAMGPDLSAYKTLGDMMEKMDAQLELARKLRAVDETDVAERVIEYHFLPDIIGNLRAFSRQETRCLDCGEKYRRMPLTGECRECGGRVNLTVHEGSVSKYVDTAIEVAERFDCRPYTKQRLKVLDQSLESIFEDDTNKQSGIADFM
ncbi:DNA polymerase II large subunit [Halorubrum ezzemoulense]|uniref:DNA polymerase II large subunit n=1 Tax=Halorubrum ezzemoulense TaxID=337243 RepID=A0A238XHY5_HALEZ|nr:MULTISPECIES: DNA polymerase II large subunit [Halorubrum]MDB9280746.1 DNA polymerase II large subunit [Halorubrum ezzemoulense]MDB9284075.1 DNA polymerase II large subunit [Halorubrum ezzemoulense]TKX66724.1 DNA polymerase II large subunit [Halorubrum sp. GN12_10-3_MGM]SNR58198.1 DNA polymerase II large subunit [Halorubrum ezzemoulense]